MAILNKDQTIGWIFSCALAEQSGMTEPTQEMWAEKNNIVTKHKVEEELMSDEIELGDAVVDTVSRFKGKVTCLNAGIDYVNVEVQPLCEDDTKLPKAEWFQIERLEKIK